MDDDVLALAHKCAEALWLKPQWHAYMECWRVTTKAYPIDGEPYRPEASDAQAFELLCWLAQRATVSIDMHPNIDGFFACLQIDPGVYFREQPISTPAELRLALMRATVKVHEGRGK